MAEATVVLEPGAAAVVSVLRIPVQIDAANVAYLKDAQWVERPARAFQHLLADTLRARGKGLVVETDQNTTGTRIGGRLLTMGYDAPTPVGGGALRCDEVARWRADRDAALRKRGIRPRARARSAWPRAQSRGELGGCRSGRLGSAVGLPEAALAPRQCRKTRRCGEGGVAARAAVQRFGVLAPELGLPVFLKVRGIPKEPRCPR